MSKKLTRLNYSYAKLISELVKSAKRHGFLFEIIGYEKFEKIGIDYPIYRFTVNAEGGRPFCLVAGVHGYEVAGSLSILELFKNRDKYLNEDVCYSIYPVINPTSFDLRQRYDDDDRDMNTLNKKTLKSKNYREIQAFYKDIKGKSFDVFLSLHEDVSAEKFYAYIFEEDKEAVYRKMITLVSGGCGILKKKKIYDDDSDGKGLVINKHDQSFEDRLYCQDRAEISLSTETPGKLSISERIKINLANIKLFSDYISELKTKD